MITNLPLFATAETLSNELTALVLSKYFQADVSLKSADRISFSSVCLFIVSVYVTTAFSSPIVRVAVIVTVEVCSGFSPARYLPSSEISDVLDDVQAIATSLSDEAS